jgi:nucleotide-binding universal stress UspA family protein
MNAQTMDTLRRDVAVKPMRITASQPKAKTGHMMGPRVLPLGPHKGARDLTFKRLLWPTDLSENAKKALPFVSSLSRIHQAEVHVLYVAEDLGAFGAWYGDFDRSELEKIQALDRKRAEKALDRLCQQHLDDCPLYIRHTAKGEPGTEILKLIEKEKPDLVILAKKGRQGRFDFGGIAERVTRQSPVPTLIIPMESDDSDKRRHNVE